MIFVQTQLQGAFIIDVNRLGDSRGFFARTFCRRQFEEHGLQPVIAQTNVAFSRTRGILRGLHFQYPPAAEAKLVRCTRGAILDVVVDLRPESSTYLRHIAVELSVDNHRALYAPERFAHGYQVLEDATEIVYQTSEFYAPESAAGLRYNDPLLDLTWPLPPSQISDQDSVWKLLQEIEPELRSRMRI
jgi:dTDP-4-dehydrorhamnose 3,5-epimerase